MTGGEVSRLVD